MPNLLPAQVSVLLPEGDRRAPAEQLESGEWIIAGRHAIILANEESVLDSGMWYEIATARWSAEDRVLSVEWMDPARTPIRVETVSQDPRVFMRILSERVNHSIVVHKSTQVSNGTTITVWIRRREDGQLFSVLAAFGPLDEACEREAAHFEQQLREGVGLD